ncbi:MAG: chemotaxis protein CheD [Proteobacteria bacterium ST_bin11]|jgi:chemotaxis protein CheD|nr:MAG: chemotaxis protein CheD [Proteobacteria bacterium ST_bin11]
MYPLKHTETYYDPYQRLRAIKISPGECCVIDSGELIVTVLGSSVTACIRDSRQRIGGMHHFMVANVSEDQPLNQAMEAMANASMDSFINRLIEMGAEEEYLEAKVFGGGNVLNSLQRANLGASSAQFLMSYLAGRGIPVVAADILDVYPRKVYFFPDTGEVLVKKLKEMKNETVLLREQAYSEWLFAGKLA